MTIDLTPALVARVIAAIQKHSKSESFSRATFAVMQQVGGVGYATARLVVDRMIEEGYIMMGQEGLCPTHSGFEHAFPELS